MVRVFVGIGSNLGDRRRHLNDALDGLPGVKAVSAVYETDPVGGPPDQPPYLNLVVELDTDLAPDRLLGVCHRLEAAAGRVRGERWGPRTLDVDILLYEGVTLDRKDLTIPHPRMWERRFVMAPLAEIAPDVVPEGWERRTEGSVRRLGML